MIKVLEAAEFIPGRISGITIIKNLIPKNVIAGAIEELKSSGKDYKTTYMKVPQLNFGVRKSNEGDAPYKNSEWANFVYNKTLYLKAIYMAYFNAIRVTTGCVISSGTEPVLHGIKKTIESGGAHTDTACLNYEEIAYKTCLTNLIYFKLPEVGGKITFFDNYKNAYTPEVEIGDMIIFDSRLMHDINSFPEGKDFYSRISMVGQIKKVGEDLYEHFV